MANAFDLTAIIRLDDSSFKNGLKGVGKVLGGFGKVAGAALGAAATGVTALTKSAVDAYGNYEQLAGGIRKLYGNMGLSLEEYAEQQGKSVDEVKAQWQSLENAQKKVLKNAENAYQTSGMSMNTYMETATQFSASLINSLGGDSLKAAELTDVAMRSISDNWNTFGGDLDAISNAYKGFSKQNYNMLDNLKLGYGGSREEMERLIADANEYAAAIGQASDLSIENFSDIITAIDLIQQKQQIAGTTEREATETLQGSINMTRAAWENLLTAFGDKDADLSKYFDALVDSAGIALNNIIPVAEQALSGIGRAIERAAPVLAEHLPVLISDLLPRLIGAATSLVGGVIDAVPMLISSTLPSLLQAAFQLVSAIGSAIIDNLPIIMDSAIDIIMSLADGIINALPDLIPAIITVVLTIAEKLTDPNMLMQLIQAAFQIMRALFDGLIDAIPQVVSAIPTILLNIIAAILRFVPQILASGTELMVEMGLGIARGAANVIRGVLDVLNSIGDRIRERVQAAKTWGSDLIHNFIDGILGAAGRLWDSLTGIAQGVRDFLGFSEPKEGPLSNFHTYAPDMMKLFAQGIKDNESLVTDQLSKSFNFGGDIVANVRGDRNPVRSNVGSGEGIINIVVQSVLDGRVIGETAYKYQLNKARAVG